MRRSIIGLGLLAVPGASIALFAFSTGSTFGQRCNAAFPHDVHQQERCVYEMSKGLRNYPTERSRD
jgi:hypothetical protein